MTCPECGNINSVYDAETGEDVCIGCGLVIGEHRVSEKRDWNAYDESQTKTRARTGAGETALLHDRGLSTTISVLNRDAFGGRLSAQQQAEMYRLRKWQKRSRLAPGERSLVIGLQEIAMFAEKLGLPKHACENAANIFRKALVKGLVRGRSVIGMVSASLYFACREAQIPRSLDEVADTCNVQRKELSRHYRLFINKLGGDVIPPLPKNSAITLTYINRFATAIHLPGERQGDAIKLLQGMKDLAGKDPKGLASASIYLVCTSDVFLKTKGLQKLNVTQKELAQVAGVTEVTIRNRYKDLERNYTKSIQSIQVSQPPMVTV